MKIELRERVDTPVWLVSEQSAVAYYRATVPAKMTGGAACNSIRASVRVVLVNQSCNEMRRGSARTRNSASESAGRRTML
jgi:hypothetical protein